MKKKILVSVLAGALCLGIGGVLLTGRRKCMLRGCGMAT